MSTQAKFWEEALKDNALKTVVANLKQAARTKDARLAGQCVDALRLNGYTYNGCFQIAQLGDANLTLPDFEDLMIEADEAE